MTNTDTIFQPTPHTDDDGAMIAGAVHCGEAFTDSFNAQDLSGMDAHLHFPHIILSGEQLAIWSEPGNLPVSFLMIFIATPGGLKRDTNISSRC